jgi:hypothetical protein
MDSMEGIDEYGRKRIHGRRRRAGEYILCPEQVFIEAVSSSYAVP